MSKHRVESVELQAIPMFSSLTEMQLDEVRSSARIVRIETGERLFHMGEPSTHFYYLRRGQIKLFRAAPDGGEKVVSVVSPRQTFGEAIMFMGEGVGYPVGAQAIAASELIGFKSDAIREFLRGSTDTCFQVMASMSRRLRELVLQIDELTLHNATYRLVSYLLRQLPEGALHSSDVQLMTPKLVVASRLSIQPETFSRILKRLRSGGLIEVDGSHIVLRDIEGLRGLTDQ